MSRHSLCVRLLSLVSCAAMAAVGEAQVGVGVGRGVVVRTPFVGVGVSPGGGVRVNAPGAVVRTPGYYGPRRVVVGAPFGVYGYRGVGGYYGGRTVVTAGARVSTEAAAYASPTPAGGVVTVSGTTDYDVPTAADLSSLSTDEFAVRLTDAVAALHARLDLFDGGEGWQSYFQTSPEGWNESNATDVLLRRFDSVSRQSEFAMIAALPEFRATHALLGAYAASLAQPAATTPGVSVDVDAPGANVSVRSGAETIPAPAAAGSRAKPATRGERSVLIDVR